MKINQRIAVAIAVIVALVGGLLIVTAPSAKGAEACVPKDAWTETIKHEAVTKEVFHPAETKEVTVGDQRYSWNPKGPKDETDGPPNDSTPLTDPDHWQGNTSNWKGEAIGVVYQEGNGNGGNNASWFYWTGKTEIVETKPAYTETVVVKEAWTETIEHEAVTCDDNPTDPTEPTEPTVPTETPTDPGPEGEPETPVKPEVPRVDKPQTPVVDSPSEPKGNAPKPNVPTVPTAVDAGI